jgi:hypothetical protein
MCLTLEAPVMSGASGLAKVLKPFSVGIERDTA